MDGTTLAISLPNGGLSQQMLPLGDKIDRVSLEVNPNPFSGQLTMQIASSKILEGQLSIFNSAGQVIYTQVITSFSGQQRLTIAEAVNWADGVYYYQLDTNLSSLKGKFIKAAQ